MARREEVVVIDAEGRDKGKQFLIREMPAYQAEEWFMRAMMLLARSGTDVPSDIFEHGSMGFAAMGIGAAISGLGKAPWHEVKPMMDEMLACLASYQSPAGVAVTIHSQIMQQIEEPRTIMRLREEILSLHLGFSIAARLLDFRAATVAMMEGLGQITKISPAPSDQPFPVD